MKMEIKEEFKKIYIEHSTSIYNRIINALHDYYYLSELEEIVKNISFTDVEKFFLGNSLTCLGTIIYSLKKDFALLVWGLCIDSNKNANTIYKLRNNIIRNFAFSVDKTYFTINPKFNNDLNTTLRDARSKLIAHSDYIISFGTLNLDLLFNEFLQFIDLFNQCVTNELTRNLIIDAKKCFDINSQCKYGLKQLFTGEMLDFYKKIGGML